VTRHPLLVSEMGRLQVLYYLVLAVAILLGAALLLILVNLRASLTTALTPGTRLLGSALAAAFFVTALFVALLGVLVVAGVANAY
jgi:hypothetical protein